jgi:hypothetical protein
MRENNCEVKMKKTITGLLLLLLLSIPVACAQPTNVEPAPETQVPAANQSPESLIPRLDSPPPVGVSILEGNPVIYERRDYVMRGQFSFLYIYEGGSILFVEETGLRMATSQNPATRTWKTGKLPSEELDSLMKLFTGSGFKKLDEYYKFPGEPIKGGPAGGFRMGDMGFTVSINYGSLSKTVTAIGYLTPDGGETYPDMPSPLDKIYVQLRAAALRTNEVTAENIQSSLAWE